jgi:ribosomal-protein-alanine N-acetyltransferase
MMKLLIRPLTVDDLTEVLAIEQACNQFPWTAGILNDCLKARYPSWVIIENNQLVGYAMMSYAAAECHILNICVLPYARRRGYAKELMGAMLNYAKELSAEMVFLEVRKSNIAALNLYHQLGFNEIGVRKAYYPAVNNNREDAIMLGYYVG